MKRIPTLLLLGIATYCNAQKINRNILHLTLGQSREKTEQIIEQNEYRVKPLNDHGGLGLFSEVSFGGIEWEGGTLGFCGNNLCSVGLINQYGSETQFKILKTALLKKYIKYLIKEEKNKIVFSDGDTMITLNTTTLPILYSDKKSTFVGLTYESTKIDTYSFDEL